MRLQGKLILVIMLSIIASMLLLAIVVFSQLRQRSELELFNQMQLLLDQTQNKTQSFVENTIANGKIFSSSNLMDRYVLVEDEAERYDLMQPALLRLFTKYQRAYPEYREIRLMLPDGYEDTRIAQPQLPNLTDDEANTPYFASMKESIASHWTSVIKNPDDAETTLLVSVPIYLSDPGVPAIRATPTLRGYMVVTASLEMLKQQIETSTIGQSGYLIAIDNQNKITFHPDESRIGTDATPLMQAFIKDSLNLNDSLQIDQITESKIDEKNVYVLGKKLHTDLILLSVLPESEFKTISQNLATAVALICFGAIAVTSYLLYRLLYKLVVSPLKQLGQLAEHIGEGRDADMSDIDLLRNDEIGDLTRAFYNMNHKLSSSIQQLQHSHKKIEHLAYRDSLTSLPNRRLFLKLLKQAIESENSESFGTALLFLDLDDFKKVNDSLGHEAGDTMLQEVANRLEFCISHNHKTATHQTQASGSGTVARLGGDEFIVLIRESNISQSAVLLAEQILSALKKPIRLMDHEFLIGTSIGIACFPEHGKDVESLMKNADTAMYEAKHQEKNCYRIYKDNMANGVQERVSLEIELRAAVETRALTLHYQPQYETGSRELIGLEALLRWHHPVHGFIPPDKFVVMAENMGLIGELGNWVIDEACRQWSQWNSLGIAPPRIAVNVSQRQFKLGYLPDVVQKALLTHKMPAYALEIEITESSMMEAPIDVVSSLNVIRETGVRIAMDDFGTGYSSLSSLTSLPIDILKIDRSFVTGVKVGLPNEKIVSAILSLAHSLGLEVIAEGVETEEDYQYMLGRGCEICQGYLFSPPLSDSETEALLSSGNGKITKAA